MVACHFCPDRRAWDEKEIVYYLWNGGGHTQDADAQVLHIAPSITREQIPGSVPTCPECLKNLMRD